LTRSECVDLWAVVSVTRTSLVWSAGQSNSERAHLRSRQSSSGTPLSQSRKRLATDQTVWKEISSRKAGVRGSCVRRNRSQDSKKSAPSTFRAQVSDRAAKSIEAAFEVRNLAGRRFAFLRTTPPAGYVEFHDYG
jgi:hypothetical protein